MSKTPEQEQVFNAKIRKLIYAVATITNVVTVYLLSVEQITGAEVALVNGITAAVLVMAGLNVQNNHEGVK